MAVGVVLWSVIYQELWAREEKVIAVKWGTSGFEEVEKDRCLEAALSPSVLRLDYCKYVSSCHRLRKAMCRPISRGPLVTNELPGANEYLSCIRPFKLAHIFNQSAGIRTWARLYSGR